MPLDPQLAALLQLLDSPGVQHLWEGSPEAGRASFRAMTCDAVAPDQVVPVGAVTELTVTGGAGECGARLYRPGGTGTWPTLVYLHGGGFVVGDLDTHDQACRRICAGADAVVLSVDYRLAPEHPFPAAIDDAVAALRWAHEHLPELGGSPRLVVGGDSAGANLAAVAAQEARELVAAQVLIYPTVDPLGDYPSRRENATGYFLDKPTMDWFGGHYLHGVRPDLSDPRLLPLLGDLAGLPRALVATAEFDPLRDEGEAYADAMAASGVPVEKVRYDGLIHGFFDLGPWSAACARAVDDLVVRIRAVLHGA